MKTLRAAALCILVAAGGPAAAHSKKEQTVPFDGAVLTNSPETISMRFTMPLRVTLLTLTDATGATYDVMRTDGMQLVTDVSAKPSELPSGKYEVNWRGLAEDGHPMQGSFSFEVSE